MSLTEFIRYKGFQELRDKFKTVFPNPSNKPKGIIVAPPLTNNYGLVGQAFDYLLRFLLEFRHRSKINTHEGWVADGAYNAITSKIENSNPNSNTILIGYSRDVEKDKSDFLKLLQNKYLAAKLDYQKFLNDGLFTDSIIKSALYLAALDIYSRKGIIDVNLANESELDIQDIRQLISLIKNDHFKVENNCFINPTFGAGSSLVGGADADLIIDDTLIEIKVTKKLLIERRYLNQLIDYYILSLIGGVNDNVNLKPIKNIGIYFARHGILWKVALTEIATENAILEFKNWFYCYAQDPYLPEEHRKASAEKRERRVRERKEMLKNKMENNQSVTQIFKTELLASKRKKSKKKKTKKDKKTTNS